jgi:four helix bundle protein
MAKIEKFEDLDCWKASRALVNLVYDLCENEKLSKDWDTVRQIKRASLSSMNNVAEGFARFSDKEFVRFLDIAQASSTEVRSMSYVLLDRKYISEKEFQQLQESSLKVCNLISGLIRHIVKKNGVGFKIWFAFFISTSWLMNTITQTHFNS